MAKKKVSRIGYVARKDDVNFLLGAQHIFDAPTLVLNGIYSNTHPDWIQPQVKKVRVTVEEV